MKLVGDAHLIKCPFSRYFTSVCAILGDEIVLIDSGIPSSPDEAILPYLEALGRKPEEIAYVILTHGHFDHCGGARLLKERFSAKVILHELDRPYLEDASLVDRELNARFGFPLAKQAQFQSTSADITVNDGDTLQVAGHELAFLHLPGHSPGSMAVVDRELSLYVAGDSPQGKGAGRPLIFHSLTEYEESMIRLASREIGVLVLGHPFPPLEKPVLESDEARLHLKESIGGARELTPKVEKALRETTETIGLEDMQPKLPEMHAASIGCVLEALVREGKARKLTVHGRPSWKRT